MYKVHPLHYNYTYLYKFTTNFSTSLHFTVYTLDYKKYSSWIFFFEMSKGPLTMFTLPIFVAQLNAVLSLFCIKSQ